MATERRTFKPAKPVECSHCQTYVAERDGLCGNCLLKGADVLSAEESFARRVADGRKAADAAAKKAFQDEMRKINEEAVDEVLGGQKSDRVSNAV